MPSVADPLFAVLHFKELGWPGWEHFVASSPEAKTSAGSVAHHDGSDRANGILIFQAQVSEH